MRGIIGSMSDDHNPDYLYSSIIENRRRRLRRLLLSTSLVIVAVASLITASYGNAPFWYTFGAILFGFAGLNYWHAGQKNNS
jgi:hypothetical protein